MRLKEWFIRVVFVGCAFAGLMARREKEGAGSGMSLDECSSMAYRAGRNMAAWFVFHEKGEM